MKRYCLFIIIFISITISFCGKKEDEHLPKGILNHKEMVSILTDIHLMEIAVNLQFTTQHNITASRDKLRENIFINHHTTTSIFNKSYKYYNDHLPELDLIYKDVITELSEEQAKNSTKK